MRLESRDAEAMAAIRLNRPLYDFIAGGADDESTVAANLAAWEGVSLSPHVLRDVSAVDTSIELLDSRLSAPVVLSPMGAHRRVHEGGEVAVASAARAAGLCFVQGIAGFCSIEEIGAVGGTNWLQLYWLNDRGIIADLVKRAEAADFSAIVVTVDAPVPSLRLRDKRNDLRDPSYMRFGCLDKYDAQIDRTDGFFYFTSLVDPSIGWDDIEWLAQLTPLPVVVKGVVRPDDAVRALGAGARAVFVSNHGGRQLGRVVATARALPAVREAVGDAATVLVDGGIRGGVDVLSAIGLGATAVGIGRPILFALAALGEEGLAALVDTITSDLRRSMALCGLGGIDQADASLVSL